MDLAYSFQAKTETGRSVSGLVIASSTPMALGKVKKIGFIKPRVSVSIGETIRGWFGAEFDKRELSRFYRTMAARLDRDSTILQALDGADDYITDVRLKSAVSIMYTSIMEGRLLYEAMTTAGFADRDCKVIRALGEGGKTAKAFGDLSLEVERERRRSAGIKATMRQPIMVLFLVYIAFPGIIFWMAPKMMDFFKKIGEMRMKMPGPAAAFYEMVGFLNNNQFMFWLIYPCIPFACFFLTRSKWFDKQVDKIRLFKEISVKTDHAAVWGGYSLLYGVGVPPADIAEFMGTACKRADSKKALSKFSKQLRAGVDENTAIERAEFPKFVASAYKAAKQSNNIELDLERFSGTLTDDVELLTERLTDFMMLLSKLMIALVIFGMFFMTVFPMAGTVMANL
jgi:type II secretory pathway component PulF